jgi:hypothetical protein
MRIKINLDDFKQLVKSPKVVKTREIHVTKEMIKQIMFRTNLEFKKTTDEIIL